MKGLYHTKYKNWEIVFQQNMGSVPKQKNTKAYKTNGNI